MTARRFRDNVREVPGPCARWDDDDAEFIRDTLERIGDKWSVLLIGTLEAGPLRYSDLAYAVPGISQRMLTLTLSHLTRDGIVSRTAYAEVPPRVEYALTELGRTLLSSVLALAGWAADHHAEVRQNRDAAEVAARAAQPA
jgi:DNA-binding HxlR family transcriptional regulator